MHVSIRKSDAALLRSCARRPWASAIYNPRFQSLLDRLAEQVRLTEPTLRSADPRVNTVRKLVIDKFGEGCHVYNDKLRDGKRSLKICWSMPQPQCEALYRELRDALGMRNLEWALVRCDRRRPGDRVPSKFYLRVFLPPKDFA